MNNLEDYQWEAIEKSLQKIDDLYQITSDSRTEIALLRLSLEENVKEKISDLQKEVKKKVNKLDCARLHKNIEQRKKTALDWLKVSIPWALTIAFGVLAYFK